MRNFLFLFLLFLPFAGFSQEESDEVIVADGFQWKDSPVYLGGDFQLSMFRRAGAGTYAPQPGWAIGIWTDLILKKKHKVRSGLEFQYRTFSLNSFSSGTNSGGKAYRKTIEGTSRMYFFQLPWLFDPGRQNSEKKLRLLAGVSGGLRIFTRQNFSYRYEIPADSLVITGEENSGNNAMDILELNAVAALVFKPLENMELSLGLGYKLCGFSIGKVAFISRTEQNTLLNFRAIFRICQIEDLRL